MCWTLFWVHDELEVSNFTINMWYWSKVDSANSKQLNSENLKTITELDPSPQSPVSLEQCRLKESLRHLHIQGEIIVTKVRKLVMEDESMVLLELEKEYRVRGIYDDKTLVTKAVH